MPSCWPGWDDFEDGRQELEGISQRYIERGAEGEWMVGAFHSALTEIWRGDFAEASLIGKDAMERARHLHGDLPMSVALIIQGAVAAYAGDEPAARRDAIAALDAARGVTPRPWSRCGPRRRWDFSRCPWAITKRRWTFSARR